MSLVAIFADNPFENEMRIDCKMLIMNTEKYGEICILPGYYNCIFNIKNSNITVFADRDKYCITVIGSGVVKIENDQFICFGKFNCLKETDC